MRELFRSFKIIAVVLLVPVVPFVLFGASIDKWAERWRESPPEPPVVAAVAVGLLATDIFLPIPSSLISTLAGYQLGVVGGTIACWSGMSLGAVFGFALARRCGRPFARWLSKESDLQRMQAISRRFGPGVLVLARGVPILAEASVLLMGIHRLPWRRFLPPVLLSNFGIALAYAAFGQFAERHQWLPLAIGISIAVPVLLTAAVQWWFSRQRIGEEHSPPPGTN